MNLPIHFGRKFQLWVYSVSHGQLLLRSVKDKDHQTQVDIFFKNVIFVCIPSSFDGLVVSEIDFDEFLKLNISTGRMPAKGKRYFSVKGENWSGLIVAAYVAWLENEAEYYDVSSLMSSP